MTLSKSSPAPLLSDLRQLIQSARQQVARAVDGRLVLLYWEAGRRVRQEILREKRAEYGHEIIQTLSGQLAAEFGAGWSRFNLARMVQFAERFPTTRIVATLSQQLGWSHFKEILVVVQFRFTEQMKETLSDARYIPDEQIS
jgi:hypothetical protein